MPLRDVPRRLATRTIIRSRAAKWKLYEWTYPPRRGERVLDVGVSRHERLPVENYFLRNYPFPQQLTGVGVSDLGGLPARFPDVTFIQADGRSMPFGDNEFDIVHSNAVVEHVGPRVEQARFIHEVVRVAERGFITTPNRWFPIEPHVRLPLFHWMPRAAALTLLRVLGHRGWSSVWLLSRRNFAELFPPDVTVSIRTQRVAGLPAVFIALFAKRQGEAQTRLNDRA